MHPSIRPSVPPSSVRHKKKASTPTPAVGAFLLPIFVPLLLASLSISSRLFYLFILFRSVGCLMERTVALRHQLKMPRKEIRNKERSSFDVSCSCSPRASPLLHNSTLRRGKTVGPINCRGIAPSLKLQFVIVSLGKRSLRPSRRRSTEHYFIPLVRGTKKK